MFPSCHAKACFYYAISQTSWKVNFGYDRTANCVWYKQTPVNSLPYRDYVAVSMSYRSQGSLRVTTIKIYSPFAIFVIIYKVTFHKCTWNS